MISRITPLLLFIGLAWGQVTVDGYAYLENQSDHSGIQVLFEAETPSAVSDSAFTSETGSYSIGMAAGIYSVHFSHDGYQPYTLPQNYTFAGDSYTLPDVMLTGGAVQEVSGNVSGEWFSDTTYHVVGDITVDGSDTLIVYPGTMVKFMDFYSLSVYGSMFAYGMESYMITFTSGLSSPAAGDWAGIRFYSDSNASVLQYCDMGYGSSGTEWNDGLLWFEYTNDAQIEVANSNIHHSTKNGIYCYYSSPTITGNTIHSNNDYGIYFYNNSSPTITGNTIHSNHKGINFESSSPTITENMIHSNDFGIFFYDNSSPTITENMIHSNDYGIYLDSSSPTITENMIHSNDYGIFYGTSSPTITGNTIHSNNDYGIYFYDNSSPFIENNIITENGYGILADSQPEMIAYNGLWNNSYYNYFGDYLPAAIGNLITTNANGDSCDTYYNIQANPLFVDPASGDYHLTENSPCIDAGDPNLPLDPDSTLADMGAFYFDQSAVGFHEDLVILPNKIYLYQNHPNPFNPVTTLRYDLPEDAMVNITIYDMMGRVVNNLVSSQQNVGYESVQWNATNNLGEPVSAGLYLYTIQAGKFRQTKKMVLLK